jgi:hypothetical protein
MTAYPSFVYKPIGMFPARADAPATLPDIGGILARTADNGPDKPHMKVCFRPLLDSVDTS